jgi:hypothetical protein
VPNRVSIAQTLDLTAVWASERPCMHVNVWGEWCAVVGTACVWRWPRPVAVAAVVAVVAALRVCVQGMSYPSVSQ